MKPKVPDRISKAGARKKRPPRSLSHTLSSSLLSKQLAVLNLISDVGSPLKKDSVRTNERASAVMPDGSGMVESKSNGKPSQESARKEIAAEEKSKAHNTLANIGKKPLNRVTREDCAVDINDSKMLKLPNTIQLVHSDLPVSEADNIDKLIGLFLFRQIVSPNDPSQKCLLCPFETKNRLDGELEEHYSSVHELACQTFMAEFDVNVVFACVPPGFTERSSFDCDNCPFCAITLKSFTELREHYSDSHSKSVRLVQEDQVAELGSSLFCSVCSAMSKNFTEHHDHMKTVHRMRTYECRFCTFITSEADRLKSHVETEHLCGEVPQATTPTTTRNTVSKGSKIKLECPVCRRFIDGKVKLDQHILLAHSVKTDGADGWSCSNCHKPCGSAKDFTAHVFTCASSRNVERRTQCKPAFAKQTIRVYKCNQCSAAYVSKKLIKEHLDETKHNQGHEVVRILDPEAHSCFLCDKSYPTTEMYTKHLLHVHMVWRRKKKSLNHKDTSSPRDVINSSLLAENIPSKEDLDSIDFPNKTGHYCHVCDSVISCYQLFYLHMQDLHSAEKCFACVLTSCSRTYTSPRKFRQHAELHPQEPVHACSICDSTFLNDEDLKQHELSLEHGSKYVEMHQKCRPSGTEARNYQCKVCHTWFGLRRYFINHMESDNHDYKCRKCGLRYLQPGSRRLHIQLVHPEIATACEFCGIKTQSLEAVWGHLETHGIFQECTICPRRFLHKEQVTTHMETYHTPGNAFQCPWEGCTRQLVTKISLYFHLKTHRKDKDRKCRICRKFFSNRKLLEAHLKTHDTEEEIKPKGTSEATSEATSIATCEATSIATSEATSIATSEATTETEKPSDSKPGSEIDLIQLICAGCKKGFDDEDQFGGHDCKAAVQPTSTADSKVSEAFGDFENKEKNLDIKLKSKSSNPDPSSKKSDSVNDMLRTVSENTEISPMQGKSSKSIDLDRTSEAKPPDARLHKCNRFHRKIYDAK